MKTEKDEELYSVAMIFKKSVSIAYGKVEDREALSSRVLWAISEEEAFGKAYSQCQDMYKGWALTMNLVVPIPDELRLNTLTT